MEEVHQTSKLWVLSPKVVPPHQQVLVSSPKEVIAANDSSSLHGNVTVRKNKRNRKSYAEIVKEKISERKGDKQKTLAVEYKKKMMTNRKT